jgi:hypothetical protein
MKKLFKKPLVLAILFLCLPVAWCSIPMKTVVSIIIHLEDEAGVPLAREASAAFLDAEGKTIISIEGDRGFHWIHWWASSEFPEQSKLTPDDAKKARRAVVTAKGCESAETPIELERIYEGLSFMPHGGGPAYMYYKLEKTLRLKC